MNSMFHGHSVVEIRMVVMYDINFERNVTVMPLKCHAKMLIVLKNAKRNASVFFNNRNIQW